MDKKELKKILKPIIEECVKEVLYEENGIVQKIVAESVKGSLSGLQQVLGEHSKVIDKQIPLKKNQLDPELRAHLNESRNRLDEKINNNKANLNEVIRKKMGKDVDVFKGTKPLKEKRDSTVNTYGPLRDRDPDDPGVDLSMFGF